MAMPIEIWKVLLVLAGLCTTHSWFIKDRRNYTHAITGVIATILWFVVGIISLIGITMENGTVWSAGWLAWIFVGIGVIQALITIVEILDIINERKNGKTVYLDHVGL